MNKFLLLVLVVCIVSICDAHKKGKKKESKDNKEHHHKGRYEKFSVYKKNENRMSKEDTLQGIQKYDVGRYSKHSYKMKGDYELEKKRKFGLRKKGKGKKHKKVAMDWMKFKPENECVPHCMKNEVCISGPLDSKAFCVKKRNLKKSIKTFQRYQKKEMKEWRKFKKEHYNNIYDHDDDDMKMYGGKDNRKQQWQDKKIDSTGHAKDKFIKKHRGGKHGKHHFKPDPPAFVEKDSECSSTEFNEMRTRMMGWFHVLHGQDHLVKKQEKGSLKHFHKHVSVKKELRENGEGGKCQCFKSAMWQFHEMDSDKDNALTPAELRMVEENSLEPCVKPYLTSCDRDHNGLLDETEWCCCFSSVVAPCFQKLDELKKSGDKLAYVPRCDKEGYYMREQCQGDGGDSYGCWCVDYNGNEFKGTFTKGRAHCSKVALRGLGKTPML